MMLMMGFLIMGCCTSSSSLLVALNEKIIQIDFLDFLLINGWGRQARNDEQEQVSPPAPISDQQPNKVYPLDCVAGARKECDGKSNRQNCIDTYKKKCMNDGGYWGTKPVTPAAPLAPLTPLTPAAPQCDTLALRALKEKYGDYQGNTKDPTPLTKLIWYSMNKSIPTFASREYADGVGWRCPGGYVDTKCDDTYYSKYHCYKW